MIVTDDRSRIEIECLRRIAFFGTAVFVFSILTAAVVIPMIGNYMQHIESNLKSEIDFCKHRSNGLWEEYFAVCFYDTNYQCDEVNLLQTNFQQ